jgi:hypothetical protein
MILFQDFNCPACKFNTENMALLNRHINSCQEHKIWSQTHKPKYFKCNNCKITYITKELLTNHLMTCFKKSS